MRMTCSYSPGEFAASMAAAQAKIARAATGAVKEAADLAKTAGRASIAAGGFGKKWQNALRAKVYPSSGTSLTPAAWIYHKIPYAEVFETGATIGPKKAKFLWLPLPSAPRVAGNRAITPEQYVELIGPLQFINPPGRRPMLVGLQAKISNRQGAGRFGRLKKVGKISTQVVPLYFGVPAITDPKKFDIIAAIRSVQGQLGELYLKHLKD
jgi:Family of unknown function (DUF6441)